MRQNELLAQIRAHQNRKKTIVFDTRQPEVASNMKIAKILSFWRFLAIFAHFCSLEKTAVWGKTNRQHNSQDTFGHTKNAKTLSFWHLTLVFPERGAPGTKTRKKNAVFNTRQPDSRRRLLQKLKNRKNPQFLTLDTHFPWELLHRARFSWLLGCAKIEKKRKAREREGKMMMMMVRWWWEDDDDEMMMMMMTRMMMRWWWADDEQTNTTGDF